jgi:hypothetical protein
VILLVNPRATRPENRRFPLSVMAVGAGLPDDVSWKIVDGNLPGLEVVTSVSALVERQEALGDPVIAVALTVMPGPQLVSAVPISKALKARWPAIPIIWGGNFGSLYPDPVLNAPYVDWLVRGQGEDSFRELIDAIGGSETRRRSPASPIVYPTGRITSHPNAPGAAPVICPLRGTTRSTLATISIRRSWAAARASTRHRSAVPSAVTSAA